MRERGGHSGADVSFPDGDPSFQRREWLLNRVGWALMALVVLAGLAGVWGGGGLGSQAQAASADGRMRVDYERFVRNLGETTVQIRFAPGSARDGMIRLSVSQEYLSQNEVMATTPDPDTIVADNGSLVYTFPVRGDSPLTVTFDLRPTSGMGMLDATVGGASVGPVRFRQVVYP
ncbi:hypothetical protein SAXI111661_13580 [Saccharomonospora xinjiangensis]|uniref:hypothetical protein n=1 Tax=Saccharomonospora xinjiangensis TaxID=75294 RepID=UPI00106FA2D9|nr:hypothetical protein [Saccharomonospora xinjiangensis]QBQ60594.1 hypothetical protein EYD13_11205 [Saccharomonospora xinjiangensis]